MYVRFSICGAATNFGIRVNALFMKTLEDAEQNTLITELQKRGHVVVKDQSVGYGPSIMGH